MRPDSSSMPAWAVPDPAPPTPAIAPDAQQFRRVGEGRAVMDNGGYRHGRGCRRPFRPGPPRRRRGCAGRFVQKPGRRYMPISGHRSLAEVARRTIEAGSKGLAQGTVDRPDRIETATGSHGQVDDGRLAGRVGLFNRIRGLRFAQGIRGHEPLRRDRPARRKGLRPADGGDLPPHPKAQVLRARRAEGRPSAKDGNRRAGPETVGGVAEIRQVRRGGQGRHDEATGCLSTLAAKEHRIPARA